MGLLFKIQTNKINIITVFHSRILQSENEGSEDELAFLKPHSLLATEPESEPSSPDHKPKLFPCKYMKVRMTSLGSWALLII